MGTFATAHAAGTAEEAGSELIKQLREGLGGASPGLVLFFSSTAQPVQELAPRMAEAFPSATVLGSSSSGEFTGDHWGKSSVVAFASAGDFVAHGGFGTGLKQNPEAAVTAALAGVPAAVEGYDHRTALLLLDPLSGTGEEATLIAGAMLGPDVRLAGGAAGDDLSMSETTVSHGSDVASDAFAVAVLFSKAPVGVGVCHGHQPISGDLKVTKAEGATVSELDDRPAWDVWKEQTRDAAAEIGLDPEKLGADDVGAYLLRFEAGIASGGEYKIRAPLTRNDDGSLGFACGIPSGATIRITGTVPSRQIESAKIAASRARQALGGPVGGALVFDCICRHLILGDEFDQALKGISDELGGAPLVGFETYGEIALNVGDMSGFHNTTTVVLAFPADW